MVNGGTSSLDEISDMTRDIQTKLIRVLQDGVIERVGSSNAVAGDV